MATLSDAAKRFIVQAFACYDTPSQVAEAVKEEFGIDVPRNQVGQYDPTKVAGAALATKWRDLFQEIHVPTPSSRGNADVPVVRPRLRKTGSACGSARMASSRALRALSRAPPALLDSSSRGRDGTAGCLRFRRTDAGSRPSPCTPAEGTAAGTTAGGGRKRVRAGIHRRGAGAARYARASAPTVRCVIGADPATSWRGYRRHSPPCVRLEEPGRNEHAVSRRRPRRYRNFNKLPGAYSVRTAIQGDPPGAHLRIQLLDRHPRLPRHAEDGRPGQAHRAEPSRSGRRGASRFHPARGPGAGSAAPADSGGAFPAAEDGVPVLPEQRLGPRLDGRGPRRTW
ncbi:DUF2280 domain-containing protein [Bordetella bronchiseptica]|uniref:DUF2280 domain-containing protein n=1 Tax=Bordetella bronchiseptica TaxID=518 RepID=UPI0009B870DD|nr:DUF2280 domain-containing protein [Bordetella bronchiseptica]